MTTIINPDIVFLDVTVPTATKKEALEIISKQISRVTDLPVSELFTGFSDRENLSTTGFGSGFAIPHTKIKNAQGLVAFFRFSHPIPWEAMDDEPITTAIALVMPEADQSNQHLKMISKLARLLMHDEFIETLHSLNTEATITEYLNMKLED